MKRKINDKCPRCGAELTRKASIRDYSYMFMLICEKCGYTSKKRPVSI
ncbi:MAG: hypothetical protein QXT81_01930 [Candidatus Bathyarchaeia archaeon]